MARVRLACKSCGQEVEREEKSAPKNNKEAKQIRFNCSCGATNLRDGSAIVAEKKAKKPVKPATVKPVDKPVEPVKKPVDRSKIDDEESEGSPVIIQ